MITKKDGKFIVELNDTDLDPASASKQSFEIANKIIFSEINGIKTDAPKEIFDMAMEIKELVKTLNEECFEFIQAFITALPNEITEENVIKAKDKLEACALIFGKTNAHNFYRLTYSYNAFAELCKKYKYTKVTEVK